MELTRNQKIAIVVGMLVLLSASAGAAWFFIDQKKKKDKKDAAAAGGAGGDMSLIKKPDGICYRNPNGLGEYQVGMIATGDTEGDVKKGDCFKIDTDGKFIKLV
jgi:hypothetical protein